MTRQEGFNLRVPLDIKAECKEMARKQRLSLNQWVVNAMEEKMIKDQKAKTDS